MSDLTIAALAAEARRHFTLHTRDNETTYWAYDGSSDSGPVWIYDMIQDAHGDMFPDDFKYQFVVEALNDIADSGAETVDDARDIETESDIYTHDLLKWLSSRNDRVEYCDQYAREIGDGTSDFGDTLARISGGQYVEKREVLNAVLDALEAQQVVVAHG